MSSQYKIFKELHQQDEPLLLGNAWNAQSAKVFEKSQIKAIGTSSSALAATLGYKDGENMSFAEYLFIIRRIKATTSVPLTVDLETGYGKTEEEIVNNLRLLRDEGVAGVNIEDSAIDNGKRSIVNTETFAKKLGSITQRLRAERIEIFINVRCDAFLLNLPDARNEAIKRIAAYEKSGADGIFLPCITKADDIKAAVNATKLPINVMCMPDLPDFSQLKSFGVKRISMGDFLNNSLYKKMEELVQEVMEEKSFACFF